ncbi:MAG: 6-phosphofructokinase [Epulopiscium sp.]|nr:6-phosphofructokinase [Candidatus Epulonipiscium sp.]
MSKPIKTIGVLTSGGDAPGMNAAIRAVVRTALAKGIRVMGIRRGYNGLLTGDIYEMQSKDVSDIIQRGGTMLYTDRCVAFTKEEGQQRGAQMCKVFGIDGLVVIGGDGTFKGGEKLANLGINTIAVPATIDLDVACTDYTIGFDTAVNTVMDAINKIRDTSTSHDRCSLIEVMGRNAGYLALWSGMVSGAEEILIPEKDNLTDEQLIRLIIENRHKGKRHNLIIVAEGIGKSSELAKKIEETTGIETRAAILGHLQRGGSPTAIDRMHGSMMGSIAVQLLAENKNNKVVAYRNGQYVNYDINEALQMQKTVDDQMYDVCKMLSM